MFIVLILMVAAAVLFFFAKTKADARLTHVDTQRAIRTVAQGTAKKLPNWSTRETETLVFFDGVRRMAERNGVRANYIEKIYSEEMPSRSLLLAAGDMEKNGRTFTQQQLGVAELLLVMWNHLSHAEKQKFF